MEPLANWCNADYIQKYVKRIIGNENRLELSDGSSLEYDVLALNVGSKTRGTNQIPGVLNSLTTRPINLLLPKIAEKETYLKDSGITPKVVICGAGAAGTELAFGFKRRWSDIFG